MKDDFCALNLFITERCNLDCRYCFVNKNPKDFQFDFPELKKAIDIFLGLPGRRKVISFNGGEPLLEYPLLKKTFLYAQKTAQEKGMKLDLAVMTNGTLLFKNRADFLTNHHSIIKVSIDGKKEVNDFYRPFRDNPSRSSFEAILKNTKMISYPNLAASLVFGPETIDDLLKNIKFLRKQGFLFIEFYPDLYAVWSQEELGKLQKVFQELTDYYISLFEQAKKEEIFKNSLLDAIVNDIEGETGTALSCKKVHLAPNSQFYFCDKVFSLPEEERKDYSIGHISQGINLKKREKLIGWARQEIKKMTRDKCSHCQYQRYCFCPVGHYIYFRNTGQSLADYFPIFCAVAKVYLKSFLTIKKALKYHPLFIHSYQL